MMDSSQEADILKKIPALSLVVRPFMKHLTEPSLVFLKL